MHARLAGLALIALASTACHDELDSAFVRGANLPWRNYGHDFGQAWGHRGVSAPSKRDAHRADFAALEGADVVRWFLFADGRALDGSDPALVFADLDAALEIADAHGIRLMPVLFDFLWFDGAVEVDGVQLYGRRDQIDGRALDDLMAIWIEPLAARYHDDQRIYAFDLFNEPEWAVDEAVPFVAEPVSHLQMVAFLEAVAAPLRGGRPLTLGSASWLAHVELWAELDLDIVQVHHYELEELPVRDEVAMDRPVIVGELSSANTDLAERLETYIQLGYDGLLPWSLNGTDGASDRGALIDFLAEEPPWP